jgi:hypothetical protein
MASTNEDHWGVGSVHSTGEGSNDAGGKGLTVRSFCKQNIESTKRQEFDGKRASRNNRICKEI